MNSVFEYKNDQLEGAKREGTPDLRADAHGPRPPLGGPDGRARPRARHDLPQWNERSCRLANALLGLGLAKGDRVAVLAYNRVEWAEIYAATAKAGLIAVPINFRLVGPEVALHRRELRRRRR